MFLLVAFSIKYGMIHNIIGKHNDIIGLIKLYILKHCITKLFLLIGFKISHSKKLYLYKKSG